MYKYTPIKDKKGTMYSFTFFILGFSIMIISSLANFFTGVFQSLACVALMMGIFVLVRYVLPFYTYVLDDINFCVVRTMGSKEVELCNVCLYTALGISKCPKNKEEKAQFLSKFGKTRKRFNFAASLGKDHYVLVLNFNGALTEFYFDANEEFVNHFNQVIEEAKQRHHEELFD